MDKSEKGSVVILGFIGLGWSKMRGRRRENYAGVCYGEMGV